MSKVLKKLAGKESRGRKYSARFYTKRTQHSEDFGVPELHYHAMRQPTLQPRCAGNDRRRYLLWTRESPRTRQPSTQTADQYRQPLVGVCPSGRAYVDRSVPNIPLHLQKEAYAAHIRPYGRRNIWAFTNQDA